MDRMAEIRRKLKIMEDEDDDFLRGVKILHDGGRILF